MSRTVQITCDECHGVKQESNHWWQIGHRWTDKGQTMILINADPTNTWDERFYVLDFCGAACVLKFLSEQMAKGKP